MNAGTEANPMSNGRTYCVAFSVDALLSECF